MDRSKEYSALLKELENTPPALEFTVQRARVRLRKSRVGKWCGIPVASLGGVFCAFVLLVNISTSFALACGSIPALRGVTAAVSFSPSIKAALEHDYVQYIDQSQTIDGITATIDFLVVDRKQVNLFYHLESEAYQELTCDPDIRTLEGRWLEGCSYGVTHPDQGRGLRELYMEFGDFDVPDSLRVELGVRPIYQSIDSEDVTPPATFNPWGREELTSPEPMVTFTFDLHLDPNFTQQGEIVSVGQWLELGDQRVYVDQVEIYPTHVRLELEDDSENTAWLKSLSFYLEDERGNRYEKISNGISASGSTDAPFMNSHRLESSFFGNAKHLTVKITGAEWLSKERQFVLVDLVRHRAIDPMPEGVYLGSILRGTEGHRQEDGEDVYVTLIGTPIPGKQNQHYSISTWEYRDPEGTEHRFNEKSSSVRQPTAPDGTPLPEDSFDETFCLTDYPWDTVELGMTFSHRTYYKTPIALPIK